MKKLTTYVAIVSILFSQTITASDNFNEFEKIQIHQLKTNQTNTLKLKMNFAGNTFISKSDLEDLQDNKILQVDLVYTSFMRDPSFNQSALNKKRIDHLKNEHDIFGDKNIKWHLVEQKGASDFKEAKNYFHGFVIHYGKDLNYKTLSNSFSEIEKEFNAYSMNNSGGILKYNSGTRIKIQPNSVTYEDGTPVKGEFKIKYREFRNAADIAFSGIPMTFNGQNFNSMGMYEIRGEQDGKKLNLSKPAIVNFQCTKGDTGVGFYKLDESSSKWKKIKQITKENIKINKRIKREIIGEIQNEVPIGSIKVSEGYSNQNWISSHSFAGKKTKVRFGNISWKCYNKALNQVRDSIIELSRDDQNQEVVLTQKSIDLINQKIQGTKIPDLISAENFKRNNKNATLLGDGFGDKGHFYPSLVKGLNSSSFGVYNCDQIYRISNRITLLPKYVDENGTKINNKHVLCVVDLNYNGSFSYNPNSITVDKKGKNVLLLFTEDKKLFVLSESEYQKMNKDSAQPTIVMKNMTSELSSTKALKEYLNI